MPVNVWGGETWNISSSSQTSCRTQVLFSVKGPCCLSLPVWCFSLRHLSSWKCVTIFFFSCFYLKSYLNCTVNGGCRTFPHKMSHLRGSSEVFFTSELDFLEMTGGKMRKYWMKHMGPFFTWEKTFLQQRNSSVVQWLVQVSVHHIHEFFLIFTGTRIVSVEYWFPQF